MMNRRKRSLFLIFLVPVLFSLLLASCDSYQSYGEPEKVSGTRGLTLEIMRNSLPRSIYEGERLYIQLELLNEGGFDIDDGVVFVNVDPNSFSIENKEDYSRINLKGDDGVYRGEDTVKEIQLVAKEFSMPGVTAHDAEIKINACYEYQTFFQDTFCLDTDVRRTQSEKPCTTRSLSGSRGQGAPVVVSNVEPRITMGSNGAKVSLDIYIYDSGTGTVLASGASERVCTSEFNAEDFQIVTISEVAFSTYKMSEGDILCDSHTDTFNEFDLTGDKEYITCRTKEEVPFSLGTFSTPLTIKLDYGYLQTASTTMKIEKDR